MHFIITHLNQFGCFIALSNQINHDVFLISVFFSLVAESKSNLVPQIIILINCFIETKTLFKGVQKSHNIFGGHLIVV